MKYKRLTTRSKDGYAHYNCSKKDMKDCGLYYNCGECHKSTEVLYRLAELEDALESGKIIRLPCKVGDTIYWISSNNRDIIEVFVKRIALAEQDRTILYVEEKGLGEYTIMFVDDIFLTREEAEARLKELQEKGNESIKLI